MKKCKFYALCNTEEDGLHLKERNGYCEILTTKNGSYQLCFDKCGDGWRCTDYDSGLLIPFRILKKDGWAKTQFTRQEAFEFIENNLSEVIDKQTKTEFYKDCVNKMNELYGRMKEEELV